ncbi:MAG TPA: endonuclease/exonuclease/phosphatase family protein [Stackebrandtia sp.]|jgi:endonuclease/exonuclease/phosphatase family metal-dependent hydrolase|uniref:endonuclease/exonuclease/phosphatase family protein n=1 Tax=Stackebrandtia sp. TaxID=2023065 RepID=UPI002D32D2A4|nr:endonuclease/exonuclease/phosphatase family protein [Stackebrandtia sp.]HZE41860.1 endonuclease/exonuclease/phosphatase family protein [Stackebrandtia sp.]
MKRATFRYAAMGAGAALALTSGAIALAATTDAAPTITAMTWNTCANTSPPTHPTANSTCVNGRQTNKVAAGIKWHMDRHPGLNAVLLQEVCSADITKLSSTDSLKGWHFSFAPIKDQGTGSKPTAKPAPRHCATDVHTHASRGEFGVAIGVKSAATFKTRYFPDKHQPMARDRWKHWNVRQAAICADAKDLAATVCGTHLTPKDSGDADHPDAFWNAQKGQATDLRAYAEAGAYDTVLFGGDLNQAAPDGKHGYGDKSTVAPLYAAYTDCDQANYGGKRDGTGTFQNADGTRGSKIDYLFTNKGATISCAVTKKHVSTSDHIPVTITVKR